MVIALVLIPELLVVVGPRGRRRHVIVRAAALLSCLFAAQRDWEAERRSRRPSLVAQGKEAFGGAVSAAAADVPSPAAAPRAGPARSGAALDRTNDPEARRGSKGKGKAWSAQERVVL